MARRDASRPAELSEAVSGGRYAARWHRVHDWATRVVLGDVEDRPAKHPRVSIVRGQWVVDLFDDEEAEQQSLDLGALHLQLGPRGRGRQGGGRRRVIVRVFTWMIDDSQGGVHHSPQWITTGEGMSARAAAAAHNRYCRHDSEKSYRRGATAMEVVIWTAAQGARYV